MPKAAWVGAVHQVGVLGMGRGTFCPKRNVRETMKRLTVALEKFERQVIPANIIRGMGTLVLRLSSVRKSGKQGSLREAAFVLFQVTSVSIIIRVTCEAP